MSAPPRLTLLIVAINAERELARILPEMRGIGDELVIGIDDTTTDGSAAVARQFTDRIYPVPHESFRGRGRPDDLNPIECMLPYCRGEWLLRIDQDETFSPHWRDRTYVDRLLNDRTATQYLIPRRLALPPGDRYIATGHWFPDFQLRLYRNVPSLIEFNRHVHDRPRIAGEQHCLSDAWIVHWDPVWYGRERREAKARLYWELGYTQEQWPFENYEELVYRTRPLEFQYPQPSPVLVEARRQNGPFFAALEILDYPDVMLAGRKEPILLAIKNCSNRRFRPSSVFVRRGNVFPSYHWYSAADRRPYQFDGEREELPRPLEPGEWTTCFMSVIAPKDPGEYLLQPDVVEELVAWFSEYSEIPMYPVRVV